MSENTWLRANGRSVNNTLTELEAYRLKGSYGGQLNLHQIGRMLRGAVGEIENLQKELDALKKNKESAPVFLKEEKEVETPPTPPTPPVTKGAQKKKWAKPPQ